MNAAPWLEKLPPPDRWRGLALAHGPRVATWVLALALGVQAAMIVTDLTGGKPVPPPDSSAAPPPVTAHVNVAAIANNHLFGSAEAQAQPAGDAANAPPTSIPLVLTGTIASDNPEAGLAILGDSAANTKFVPVGGTLPGGVKLHSVYKDRVVLDRNGTLESLMLPRQTGPSLIGANPPPPAAMPTVENPVVDRVRQLIANEPGAISEIMRPQPVFAQGKQRGFRVYPGRNRQAFTRLGLRPGDLVTAINGTPLDDPSRGQEVFNTLSSSSEAHVTVMRNGRQQDLTLQLAQVAQEAEALIGPGNSPPPEQPVPPAEAPAPLPPPDGGESQ